MPYSPHITYAWLPSPPLQAVKHAREVMGAIRHVSTLADDEL